MPRPVLGNRYEPRFGHDRGRMPTDRFALWFATIQRLLWWILAGPIVGVERTFLISAKHYWLQYLLGPSAEARLPNKGR